MAGVKSGDHLIEINGENIEQFDHEYVVQRIRSTVYSEPLRMLVADQKTYENYKEQQKLIHHDLPEVQVLPHRCRNYIPHLSLSPLCATTIDKQLISKKSFVCQLKKVSSFYTNCFASVCV